MKSLRFRMRATLCLLAAGALVPAAAMGQASPALSHQPEPQAAPSLPQLPEILYGAAYYHEYEPTERLDQDVAMMKAAGLNVVRMGESTWSLWEPQDGHFEYAWMDRVVDAMAKAGIKVIMGTPTYSIPTWLYHEHPEILARPLGGAQTFYGPRQNMDISSPIYRWYCERLIRNLVSHYKDNPDVIGWQIDNETSSYGASNHDVYVGFVNHLKQKFGTTDALNRAWFLNYWGEDINGWEDVPTRDEAQSTGYKLEWSRWEQMRVTDFLTWQAELVRDNRGPGQFVTTDYGGMMKADVNENGVAAALDIVADNVYHDTQDHYDGTTQSIQGDFSRSLKHSNYLITETNAQTTDWTSAYQYPPYDGQLREDVYTHLSNGAEMVEYWHWASIPANQETYWKGVLSHDFEPNRAYAEVSRTGNELKRIQSHLLGFMPHNQVAILYSRDSLNAIHFMPFALSGAEWAGGSEVANYGTLVGQIHDALYHLNVGTDFVFPETQDFSQYKLLIVPALYISDDALLERIADYVKNGGHVVMTFKSGFANENSAVRWVRAPGPLREACGFSYQEFSNLAHPLALKGDPYHVGADNQAMYWAEFLMPEHAKALAYYDHPFFGRWPAITENQYGAGTLLYEGTYLSEPLQKAVLLDEMHRIGLTGPDQELPAAVHAVHGTNRDGKALSYYFNYSGEPVSFSYHGAAGNNLLSGARIAAGQTVTLKPWDLAIVEEP
jgi:beta-galactosidase